MSNDSEKIRKGDGRRKRGHRSGFTTGACAAAAARAATLGLLTGEVPASIHCALPNGQDVEFLVHAGRVEGDTAHAETIGTIWRELQFDAGIRQAQVVRQRRAHRRVTGQFQQARRIGIDAQLLGGAQHAVGLDATQPGGLDRQLADLGTDGGKRRHQPGACVRRATDDLQRRIATGIDLANLQLVGFRMLLCRHDARHHHAIKRVTQHGHFFDLEADRGQRRRERIARSRGLDVLAQPVFGELHGSIPMRRAVARL